MTQVSLVQGAEHKFKLLCTCVYNEMLGANAHWLVIQSDHFLASILRQEVKISNTHDGVIIVKCKHITSMTAHVFGPMICIFTNNNISVLVPNQL